MEGWREKEGRREGERQRTSAGEERERESVCKGEGELGSGYLEQDGGLG